MVLKDRVERVDLMYKSVQFMKKYTKKGHAGVILQQRVAKHPKRGVGPKRGEGRP